MKTFFSYLYYLLLLLIINFIVSRGMFILDIHVLGVDELKLINGLLYWFVAMLIQKTIVNKIK